jgi:hypothetical protein
MQNTIKLKKKITVLSSLKKSILLFFKIKKIKIQNKSTVVNNCLANKKGSDTELKKTKGSKQKNSNTIKLKLLSFFIDSIKIKY